MNATTEADDRRRALEDRRRYEKTVGYQKWSRVKSLAYRRFQTSINDTKPIFEFARMILTTALVLAVLVYWIHPTAEPEPSALFQRIIISMTGVGLSLIGLALFGAVYLASVRGGLYLTTCLAIAIQLHYTTSLLRISAGLVTSCIVFGTIALGVVVGGKAVQNLGTPAVHQNADGVVLNQSTTIKRVVRVE